MIKLIIHITITMEPIQRLPFQGSRAGNDSSADGEHRASLPGQQGKHEMQACAFLQAGPTSSSLSLSVSDNLSVLFSFTCVYFDPDLFIYLFYLCVLFHLICLLHPFPIHFLSLFPALSLSFSISHVAVTLRKWSLSACRSFRCCSHPAFSYTTASTVGVTENEAFFFFLSACCSCSLMNQWEEKSNLQKMIIFLVRLYFWHLT